MSLSFIPQPTNSQNILKRKYRPTDQHFGCNETTFAHISLLSPFLSTCRFPLCVFNHSTLCLCVVCFHTHVCATLDVVCHVLVCCRHCSPVHYFFSVFTAHHWASLSVCLPYLHPKFQLFIYNQLVRYCTELYFLSQHLLLNLLCLNPTPTPWNMLVFIHWHCDLVGVGL